jgi:hypothetical protein
MSGYWALLIWAQFHSIGSQSDVGSSPGQEVFLYERSETKNSKQELPGLLKVGFEICITPLPPYCNCQNHHFQMPSR